MLELMRTSNVECRWKYRVERNEYIFQLNGRRPNGHGDGYACTIRIPRPDLNDCPPPPELSYDIYFIGVSLPSSMMIYNCWSLGCNYYNYRFFDGLSHPSVSRTRTGRFFSLHPLSFSDSTPLILRLLFSSFLLPSSHSLACLSSPLLFSPLLSSPLLSSPLLFSPLLCSPLLSFPFLFFLVFLVSLVRETKDTCVYTYICAYVPYYVLEYSERKQVSKVSS